MKHRATPSFWKHFAGLDVATQERARRSFQRLHSDPRHPSLHLKSIGKFYSARVDDRHRALAVLNDAGELVWWWIGDHASYERLIRSRY